MRINKFLARAGLGSRRKVEDLIRAGKIKINDKTVNDLSTVVDLENDVVLYNKTVISFDDEYFYLALNKPSGYITTVDDQRGRPTVMDLIPEKYRSKGVYPVGRLDKDTEGLLLFTNDGTLANKLNHPKSFLEKEYFVELNNPLEDDAKIKIEKGMFLHQLKLKTRPAKIRFASNKKQALYIIISEGKKRQIRYSFKNLGCRVTHLKRVAYGPIKLKGIHKGSYKLLKKADIAKLKASVSCK